MKKALASIIEYAVSVTRPEKIVLFGSYARGNNNIYSDIDLIIITEHNYLKQESAGRIKEFARNLSLRADVFIHTPRELALAMKKPSSFLAQNIKDGTTVYQSAAKHLLK